MCGGGYGEVDSNNDGTVGGFLDFFADITDGGGAGYSGARFGGGTGSSVLDSNNDMYISEEEYKRGQLASEANDDRGGKFGDAYNSSQNIFSKFGNNIFGALPSGSIASEAALGPKYGSPIETKNAARFLQRGGVLGAIGRGLTGGSIMSSEYVAPDRGEMTRDEYDRALVQSFSSIGNTGEETVPQAVADAMGRLRGLRGGVDTSSPVVEANNNVEPVAMPAVVADDASSTSYDVVGAEDMGGGMVKVFYENNSSEIMPAINYKLMMQNYV